MFDYTESVKAILEERVEDFETRMLRDFETIKPWVPKNATSVLDIGCGLGGVDILLAREVDTISLINIIEGDGTKDHKAKFQEKTDPWGNRWVAQEFIERNVKCSVRSFPPDGDITIPSDLIISLKSWGHHYSVDVYLNLVKRSLREGGRVIMDLRKKQDGEQKMLENGFKKLDTVYESPKCLRTVFEQWVYIGPT